MKNVVKRTVIAVLLLCAALSFACFAACGSTQLPENPSGNGAGNSTENSLHTHTYVETVNEKYLKSAATCTEKAVYYKSCSCGEKGEDTFEYGTALGHSYTNYVNDNNATCEKDATETATCVHGCGTTDTRAIENTALGHNYGTPTYSWNGDKCTATRICNNDNTHKETETVAGKYVKDTDTTCTMPEKGHYAATFKNSVFTTQTTSKDSVSNGKALGHSFIKYISDNNATCTKDGTKTAQCNRAGCTVFDTVTDAGSKLGHEFTKYESDNNATYEADGTKTAQCNHAGCSASDTVTDVGSKLQSGVTFKTLSVNGENVFGKVSNATETFSFINEISTEGKMKFAVSLDIYGSQQVATKVIPLSVGDNIVYVIELLDGEPKNVYTVNVRRRPIHTVTFNTSNGSKVNSQRIEEDSCASIPSQIPTRTGYTFNKWKYDFTKPITDKTTISAEWNTDPYKIVYDLNGGTIESGNPSMYDIEQEITLTVNPTKIGYAFAGWSNNGKINVGSTGEKTFTASWSADVKLSSDGTMVTGLNNAVTNLVILSEYNGVKVTSIRYEAFYNCSSLKSVTIPNNVTSIGSYAFYGCSSLTSITIPDSVTSIGDFAFNGCSGLEEITIPFVGAEAGKTSTDTYQYPFGYIFGTSSYTDGTETKQYYYGSSTSSSTNTTYYIPSSLRKVTVTGGNILYGAFYNCSSLTSVTIGENVTSIGSSAFYNCSLTSITIPNSVTSIGGLAFYNCSSLTSITIGNGVKSIGNSPFYYCSSLNNVNYTGTIDQWVQIDFGYNLLTEVKNLYINDVLVTEANITTATEISDYAFYNCSSLTSVTIGKSVTSIGARAFYDCSSLENVKIESGNIGSSAFYNCSSLTSVTIGNSVTSIGSSAFYGLIENLYYNGDINDWVQIEGVGNLMNCGKYLYINEKLLTEANITTATKINDSAFHGCSSLTSITIGNSVTSIGDSAFENCSSLKSIVIGDSVTNIGRYAFYNCSSLTSVTIPDSVTSIGESAFRYCSSLKSIAIGNSVTNIGRYAFSYCSSLTSITIPDSVTSIGYEAFYNCSSLISVTIGNSVTSIGDCAFCNCSSLTSVTIPNSITYIGSSAFDACSSLQYNEYDNIYYLGNETNKYLCLIKAKSTDITSCTINENCKFIRRSAFYDCSLLTSITIPDSVTSIGDYAFENCISLTEINYNTTECADLSSYNHVFYNAGKEGTGIKVTVGKNVKKIPAYLFYSYYYNSSSSPKITEVVFEEGSNCVSIGESAFRDCDLLTSVTMGNSVTSIGSGAFEYCSSLVSVTIGDSVTSIGSYAFEDCYKLVEVINKSNLTITKDSSDNGYIGYYALNVKKSGESDIVNKDGYLFYTYDNVNYLLGYVGNETSLRLPENYKGQNYEIYKYAFYNCSSLISVIIPDSITSIGYSAFSGCSSLQYNEYDNAYYLGNETNKYLCLLYDKFSVTSCTINENCKVIAGRAFSGCSSLTSITIPNSVTGIGDSAFSGCSSLTSVTIGNSVTSIGRYAFYYCSSLKSITIGSSVTSIGDYAFYYCSSLKSIIIPNSVTSIGVCVFRKCGSLTSVVFKDDSTWYRTYSSANWNNKTGGTQTYVTNSSTNATYFKSTYYDYYWYKI